MRARVMYVLCAQKRNMRSGRVLFLSGSRAMFHRGLSTLSGFGCGIHNAILYDLPMLLHFIEQHELAKFLSFRQAVGQLSFTVDPPYLDMVP